MLGLPGLATTSSEPPRSIQLIINSLPDLQKFNSGQKYFVAERKPKILWGKQRGKNKTLTHIVCVCACVREKKLKTVTSSTNWKYQLNVPVAVEQFTCYALCDNFVFLGQVQSARGYAKHNSSHPQTTSVLLIVLRVAPGSPSPKSFFFTVKNLENFPLRSEQEGRHGGALLPHGPNLLCAVCTFSLCLHGFYPGSPAPCHTPNIHAWVRSERQDEDGSAIKAATSPGCENKDWAKTKLYWLPVS